ncbi:hypothetical protein Y032_0071g599 [Ancylostoma ceylanicum]|uniref:Uncharacterized protein n=1 Tax=Ancylostoma ceylanicum TaxID=53326 RepID=A0A016TY97_9BILA|nr:hypothetical protein Y032_0071g599 [Ancylostoma ceylanicum]
MAASGIFKNAKHTYDLCRCIKAAPTENFDYEILTLPNLSGCSKHYYISKHTERRDFRSLEDPIGQFSGGWNELRVPWESTYRKKKSMLPFFRHLFSNAVAYLDHVASFPKKTEKKRNNNWNKSTKLLREKEVSK